jgi:branched-chain amino acid transport system substrate-binding protein
MRKFLLATSALVLSTMAAFAAENAPGVTATSVKIGGTFPFSGPASALGNTGKALIGYVNAVNDRNGVGGRKIDFLALDDAYSPPKSVEQGRKLVEQDEVAFMFSVLGTPTNSATVKYYQDKKIPDAFIMTGAARFAVATDFPYVTTALPSYAVEAQIFAKYVRAAKPGAKVGVLYQNDDLGKNFVEGFKTVYGADFPTQVVTASYETADPTVESQILTLKAAGVDVLMIGATPKFAAQAIRRTAEIGWKPLRIINIVSSSISATLKPAGLDNAVGVVTSAFYKDPSDARWADDAGVKDYRAFMAKYLAGSDLYDINYITGYNQGGILEQLLKQCGNDLSRENINRQAHAFKDFVLPMVLPGIKITTSATRNAAFTQLQLQRWTGEKWELFGDVIGAE